MTTQQHEKILITGGTGFAGSHLVEFLVSKGLKNKIFVTHFGQANTRAHELLDPDHIYQLDLTNKDATQKVFTQIEPQKVYHLASFAQSHMDKEAIKRVLLNNIIIQLNVLNACLDLPSHPRVLSIGSALEYQQSQKALNEQHPIGNYNPYAISKINQTLLSKLYHDKFDLDIVMTRSFNHFGERQALGFVIPDFIHQILDVEKMDKKEISVGNLEAKRDFSDVKDIVQAYYLLMEKGQSGQVYNVGSGQAHSIKEILDYLVSLSPAKINVKIDQNKIRKIDNPLVLADIEKIKTLGWQPNPNIRPALKRVMNYYRKKKD